MWSLTTQHCQAIYNLIKNSSYSTFCFGSIELAPQVWFVIVNGLIDNITLKLVSDANFGTVLQLVSITQKGTVFK